MGRKSWSFVDSRVRPGDLVCFVVAGVYLFLVGVYLVATRQVRPEAPSGRSPARFALRRMAGNLIAWPVAAVRRALGLLRRSKASTDTHSQRRAAA